MNVRVENLSFAYPGAAQNTLTDVSFEVASNHVCAIVGSNGTGKSTLIKCVDGVYPIQTGSVFCGEQDLKHLKPKEKASLIGYVPQSNEIRIGLSVFDIILSGRTPHMRYKPSKADTDEVERIIERLHLERYAFRPVTSLSGGERQRVLIGRALAQKPKVMLLDEPTSNLDMRYQLEIMSLLHELSREESMSIITVMHDLNTVIQNCDEVLVLHQGQVKAHGTPEQVLTHTLIEEVYGVQTAYGSVNGRRFLVPESVIKI